MVVSSVLQGQVQMESAVEGVPEAAPIEGHEKSNGEADATIFFQHNVCRSTKDAMCLAM